MSATADDVAATTAVTQPPDGGTETQQGADSAPAVTNADEDTSRVIEPVQKRIDELTRRRYDAERERDYWREQAQRAQPREEPRPEPVPETAGKTLADFGYDEAKYQAHLFKLAEERAVAAAEKRLTQQEQRNRAQRRDAEFESREAKFAKDLPDYLDVAHKHPSMGGPVITDEMAEIIKESDLGPAIAYHLGKNPDVASSISRMSPLLQAREIGRLEAKLAEKPKPPQVSAAPPPAPKIAAGNPQVDKDPDKMSTDEWLRWRNKQLRRQ